MHGYIWYIARHFVVFVYFRLFVFSLIKRSLHSIANVFWIDNYWFSSSLIVSSCMFYWTIGIRWLFSFIWFCMHILLHWKPFLSTVMTVRGCTCSPPILSKIAFELRKSKRILWRFNARRPLVDETVIYFIGHSIGMIMIACN